MELTRRSFFTGLSAAPAAVAINLGALPQVLLAHETEARNQMGGVFWLPADDVIAQSTELLGVITPGERLRGCEYERARQQLMMLLGSEIRPQFLLREHKNGMPDIGDTVPRQRARVWNLAIALAPVFDRMEYLSKLAGHYTTMVGRSPFRA